MIKNYLIIAIRNILRKKVSSIINILGLAIGLATAIIVFLWVKHETSYAKCFDKHEELYLAYCEYNFPSGNRYVGTTSTALGPALAREYPEIINFARTSSRKWVIGNENNRFSEVGTPADSSFLSMFSLDFIKGDRDNAFSDIHNIILSESLAKKIFGDEDPINKTVQVEDWYNAKVTGVYKDFPEETHFWTNFEFFMPFEIFDTVYGWNTNEWGSQNYQTYVQLSSKNVDINKLSEKIAGIKKKYNPETDAVIRIKPITMMHLENLGGGGLITYIYVLSAVAAFILLIACINYLNLSIAISTTRSREIGLRKVVGADRKKLIFQFLTESVLLAIIAVNFAVIIVQMSLPYINEMLGKELKLIYSFSSIAILLCFGVITGILAGIYPAVIQSSFNTINCLKGTFKTKTGQLVFRKVLVIVQFFLSIVVISMTFTINKQISFIINKDLGYHKDDIICMYISNEMGRNYRTIVSELLSSPYVLHVCPSNTTLDSWESSTSGKELNWTGKEDGYEVPVIGILGVWFDFDTMYNLKMVNGRFFSPDFATDINESCVINETAVKKMGLENPIGVKIKSDNMERTVIGVVNDFHFTSLHQEVEPLIILMRWGIDMLCIRLNPDHWNEGIQHIEVTMKKMIPNQSFTYDVLDQNLKDLYAEESRVKQIMNISSILAILISCMGLFGLSSFIIQRRYKEVGIRKINGASVSQIAGIFISDFIKLILIAIILAIPLAYYLSISWLDNFAYKTHLTWAPFAIAALIVIVIALVTVIFQIYLAARKNPVDVLRYE